MTKLLLKHWFNFKTFLILFDLISWHAYSTILSHVFIYEEWEFMQWKMQTRFDLWWIKASIIISMNLKKIVKCNQTAAFFMLFSGFQKVMKVEIAHIGSLGFILFSCNLYIHIRFPTAICTWATAFIVNK